MARIYRRREVVVDRRINNERVLVPLANSVEALDSLYVLNGTAARIFDELNAGKSVEEIASSLAGDFGLPVEDVLRDTEETLAGLLQAGVLEQVGAEQLS